MLLDGGLEIYDLRSNQKWRFAPPGGEGRGSAIDWFHLGDGRRLITVNSDSVRRWVLKSNCRSTGLVRSP